MRVFLYACVRAYVHGMCMGGWVGVCGFVDN